MGDWPLRVFSFLLRLGSYLHLLDLTASETSPSCPALLQHRLLQRAARLRKTIRLELGSVNCRHCGFCSLVLRSPSIAPLRASGSRPWLSTSSCDGSVSFLLHLQHGHFPQFSLCFFLFFVFPLDVFTVLRCPPPKSPTCPFTVHHHSVLPGRISLVLYCIHFLLFFLF